MPNDSDDTGQLLEVAKAGLEALVQLNMAVEITDMGFLRIVKADSQLKARLAFSDILHAFYNIAG